MSKRSPTLLRCGDRPRAGRRHRHARAWFHRVTRRRDDGVVTVGVKLTIGGCPLRAQIKKDVETRVAVHPGVTDVKHRLGRDDQRGAQPRSCSRRAGTPARTRPNTEIPRRPASWPSPAARAASARARSPSTSPRRIAARGVHRRRARRRHLGLLGASPARHRRSARGPGGRGSRQAEDHPQRAADRVAGC